MIKFNDESWKLEALQNISAIFLVIAALIAGLFIFSNHIEKERQAEKGKNREEINWARYLNPSIPAEKSDTTILKLEKFDIWRKVLPVLRIRNFRKYLTVVHTIFHRKLS